MSCRDSLVSQLPIPPLPSENSANSVCILVFIIWNRSICKNILGEDFEGPRRESRYSSIEAVRGGAMKMKDRRAVMLISQIYTRLILICQSSVPTTNNNRASCIRRPAHRGPSALSGWKNAPKVRGQLLPQILEEFLDPGEKALAFRVGAAVLAFLFEFAQQLLLALGQIDRGLDNRLDEHVAAGGRAQHRHP